MDKITRMLIMYSRLMNGEHISKFSYIMETDCNARSFDRDVEDIRLFLSETYRSEELVYDRAENTYYLSGYHQRPLGDAEYSIIERILYDSGVLRSDELEGMLLHLASTTEKASYNIARSQKALERYAGPEHNKALLKMHNDLNISIQSQSVIRISYIAENGNTQEANILPCLLRYDSGYILLLALQAEALDGTPIQYRLDQIISFVILRRQSANEQSAISKVLSQLCSET